LVADLGNMVLAFNETRLVTEGVEGGIVLAVQVLLVGVRRTDLTLGGSGALLVGPVHEVIDIHMFVTSIIKHRHHRYVSWIGRCCTSLSAIMLFGSENGGISEFIVFN
jgi:hypothetical protein